MPPETLPGKDHHVPSLRPAPAVTPVLFRNRKDFQLAPADGPNEYDGKVRRGLKT